MKRWTTGALAVAVSGALAQAQDLDALARRVRQEIVAERHRGVDPCGALNPIASMATFVDAPPDCKALGEEMVRRLQATGTPPPRTGSSASPREAPLTEADAEKAFLDGLQGNDELGDEFTKIVSSQEAAKWRFPAFLQGENARSALATKLAAAPGASNADVQRRHEVALREIAAMTRLAGLKGADGKPLFRATSGMLSVAAKLAQASTTDPEAVIALSRMRALLVRMDVVALRGRTFTPNPQDPV